MSRKVKISRTAEKKLDKLFDYLLKKWSSKVKSSFVKKLDKAIGLIKINPEMFPVSEKEEGLHKCVISKQTSLYYRFNSKCIFIVTIFDTRQEPNKLKKDLLKE